MNILVFDIGGTAVKYGILEDGRLTQSHETPTEAHKGGRHILDLICRIAGEFSGFDTIGISTAGQVNAREGSIIYANSNIPGYTGIRIKEEVESVFHVPVAVENDVNCAALGEAVFGAGKDQNSFLCLTYGTGVGGAIVENRQIYHGSSFSAGEFGGIITHGSCRTGGCDAFDGCYERYASATALVKLVSSHYPSLTDGRKIFAALDDVGVRALIDQWIGEVLLGLTTLTHIFNPSCMILGGGIMAQPYIIEQLHLRFPSCIMPSFSHTKLLTARLGNTAGMLGAAHLASLL